MAKTPCSISAHHVSDSLHGRLDQPSLLIVSQCIAALQHVQDLETFHAATLSLQIHNPNERQGSAPEGLPCFALRPVAEAHQHRNIDINRHE